MNSTALVLRILERKLLLFAITRSRTVLVCSPVTSNRDVLIKIPMSV